MKHDRVLASTVFDFQLDDVEHVAYQLALRTLNAAGVPFVVGGAFAVYHYTDLWRNTKDLDLFLLPADLDRALDALGKAGFRTWVEAENWLAKASWGRPFLDLIFGTGNWLTSIDRQWLDRSAPGSLLGVPVRFAPVEELIWSKAYVAGRERYDAADVLHLLLRVLPAGGLDWDHLLARFGNHWQLLFSYLCLFRFAYPHDRDLIPSEVIAELAARQRAFPREPRSGRRVCRGTLLDRFSYNYDIAHGYHDPREDLAEVRGFGRQEVVRERKWSRGVAANPQSPQSSPLSRES